MPVTYAVLNELSFHNSHNPYKATKYQAREHVEAFYRLLTEAKEKGVEGLRTYIPFDEIQLIEGYSLREWSADDAVELELRQRIQDIFSGLSKSSEFPENQQGDPLIDCYHEGKQAHGIWGAIALDSLSISLQTGDPWDKPELTVSVHEMDEETLEIDEREEIVKHLYRTEHLTFHHDWLKEQTKVIIYNGNHLWSNRHRLFPLLKFCKATETQIRSLRSDALRQVIKRLTELQTACNNWKSGAFDKNTLPYCTPESEATLTTYKAEHSFECEDGQTRLFSLHTRFTPGAGRIFFYPHVTETEQRIFYVGHIGMKLPNVSY